MRIESLYLYIADKVTKYAVFYKKNTRTKDEYMEKKRNKIKKAEREAAAPLSIGLQAVERGV